MYGGFDVNSFCDSLDDGYGIFDDVADSLDFAGVGISTANPDAGLEKTVESNKKNNNKTSKLVNSSPIGTKRRGRKPGQKPTCGQCGELGHTRRKCTSL